ncbi:MAG: extracellular solute-binding protein [Clostridia bacterium]|nr:extracellular solute-binding protein [Clostridia bacterium]
MKKLVSLMLALVMALSMCSFAGASSLEGTYDVTIWVGEKAVDLTLKQVEDFNASNEYGIKINPTVEAVSEADSATQMVTDVEAGADLYCFAQDQFARLVQAGALMQLGAGASEFVKTNNDAGTVAAATSGEAIFAYPLTADNGYFLYYDKSVIPDEDVDSLEKLIADCEAAGKNFSFELNTSAWYLASFFFATGCVSEWQTDDDGKFISVHDTFNSPEGLIAVKGMKKLLDSPIHVSSSAGDDFASGSAAVVTGTWSYDTVSQILGENFGAADLPSFEVDGKEYHLGSYNGCKLMGVKPQTDAVKGAVLNQLAQYLTGEKGQMERFEALGWGPSNLADQASEAVQNNATLAALIAQNAYSIPQGQIHGSWWDLAKVIADDVKAATDDAGLQAALDNYSEKMAALFTMSDAEMNAWTVIGSINGDDWSVDLPMTKGDDGVWKTDEAYAMDAGVEFKVRQGKSWDNNFPADNFVVETAGTYYVTFDEATETVAIVAE